MLLGLHPHKTSGTEQISPRFLTEMAASNALALTFYYHTSYDQGKIALKERLLQL